VFENQLVFNNIQLTRVNDRLSWLEFFFRAGCLNNMQLKIPNTLKFFAMKKFVLSSALMLAIAGFSFAQTAPAAKPEEKHAAHHAKMAKKEMKEKAGEKKEEAKKTADATKKEVKKN
jgi:hypothetical protein